MDSLFGSGEDEDERSVFVRSVRDGVKARVLLGRSCARHIARMKLIDRIMVVFW